MIHVAYRNMPWSEKTEYRTFMPGATIQEIVDSFKKPREFETHGGVYLKREQDSCAGGNVIDRTVWSQVKPKANTALFISLVPQGGGSGGSGGGKNAFAIVAAIALIALTAWIGGGGLVALGAPSIFGAGQVGAYVAAAAVGVAGSATLAMLTKPSAGMPVEGVNGVTASSAQQSSAGISQNPLAAYQQVPGIRAENIRVSPPLLAQPFTTMEDTDQVLNMIVGCCGPNRIQNIKINDTDIADMPSGVLEYETREGWDADTLLTLVTESAFQQNINLQMSQHRLSTDAATLIEPYTGSYPKPYISRTSHNAKRFRYTLNFQSGIANYNDASLVAIPFRIRIRRVGDSTWVQLPEIHINASRREAFRQEIWLRWGNDDDETQYREDFASLSTLWKRIYYKNPEWTANSYFLASGVTPGTTDSNVVHVYAGPDFIYVHLDEDTFPVDRYDVEITRGFADAASNYTDTSYPSPAGAFTYRTASGTIHSIPAQNTVLGNVVIENYCSFRDEYPIAERGLSLIAIKARNLQVNSLSAEFGSYVNVWNGSNWNDVAVSGNPAALERDVQLGNLNARALQLARLEELSPWYDFCVDNDLKCNYYATQASVEQVSTLIAACGDAALRRSDKWGVVIDKDRSDEELSGAFHPGNMTGPLKVTKKFVTGARAIVPHFLDEDDDFADTDLEFPIYDDGYASSASALTESATYDGLTSEALVTRRARLDLRRQRMRTLLYEWECHVAHLRCKNGSLVGLAHDILVDTYGTGRVKAFQVDTDGNLQSVTMNTNFSDLPVSGYDNLFDVENVFTLADLFTLDGPKIGLQIELPDASIATIPISGVDDATLIVEGTVAAPSGLKKTCLAAIGRRDRETRRVIVSKISPKDDLYATLQGFDEAPGIFAGL
jgi:hypothetical protein